jgi:predicted acylesterase/phospholipase RssA
MTTLSSTKPPKIALALAGGGPLGAIYEIGALCALEESLVGCNFNALEHYVGVSAGAFIAAALANGMTSRELCTAFIANDSDTTDSFDPSWLMQPAYDEFAHRGILAPRLVASALWNFATGKKTWMGALEQLAPVMPTGIFSNQLIESQLARLFNQDGRTNDFRKLKSKLTLVATNLDSADAAPFGRPGWDHVPISQAVQASSALPGLFPPVEIDKQHYVDGALKKTMHASVALEEGVDLLICLNPLVPFNATLPQCPPFAPVGLAPGKQKIPRIVDGGLPSVLSQTFRSMIHSRMELGMKHYQHAYPTTDIVLIEPDHRDPELYLANTFSYAQRRHLAEHAYQQTRQLLCAGESGLSAKLARHGIRLNHETLNDKHRCLTQPVKLPTPLGRAIATLQEVMDDLETIVTTSQTRQVAH